MAIIGVSKPYVARYTDNGDGTTSYSDGTKLALATEVDISIESSDDNNLYADNMIAESDREFSGGALTVGVDDFLQDASILLLGLKSNSITVDGATATELIYDDEAVVPNMGFGCIIKKKKGGVTKWRAIVLQKIMFSIPSDAATTQGEKIDWQTQSLEATIMRDDTATHVWKREATFDTEALAEAYIKQCLDISTTAGG